MTSFVNVCDVKSAEMCHSCLKIVNNRTKMNKACVSSRRCLGSPVVRKNEFQLKGYLSRQNKITNFIYLINHGIYPPNM